MYIRRGVPHALESRSVLQPVPSHQGIPAARINQSVSWLDLRDDIEVLILASTYLTISVFRPAVTTHKKYIELKPDRL
jgi:hypothetical protein